MNISELKDLIGGGETTTLQFKRDYDNPEILRLFQRSKTFYADEMTIADTSEKDVEALKVKAYMEKIHPLLDETNSITTERLYTNLGILKDKSLTLGGLLFFASNPQRYRPAFCVKAISFFGNSIGGMDYRDSRDISGTIPELFEGGMNFFKGLLRHRQNGQNFNSVGVLELSEVALEELLQNALIHRDYTINAPVRLMIFDNRVQIVSPGCLPNSLTVDNIKYGTATVRNNLITSYSSKIMRFRGFGTGIIRALEHQPDIELINDKESEQFVVTIPRPEID